MTSSLHLHVLMRMCYKHCYASLWLACLLDVPKVRHRCTSIATPRLPALLTHSYFGSGKVISTVMLRCSSLACSTYQKYAIAAQASPRLAFHTSNPFLLWEWEGYKPCYASTHSYFGRECIISTLGIYYS